MDDTLKRIAKRLFISLLAVAALSGCVAVPYGSPYYGSPYPSYTPYPVEGYGRPIYAAPQVYVAPPVYWGPPLYLDFGFWGGHGGHRGRWGHGRR
jgi:hypothetical protein